MPDQVDMLPFTADVLFTSFAQYNQALWPAPIIALVLALATIVLALWPVRGGERAIAGLLAAAWAWVGVRYHLLHFATLNFAAPLYGVLFIVQAMLLAVTGALLGRVGFRLRSGLAGWAGLGLALAVLILWPLADALGHGWPSARVVGLAPGATAAFTLGLLLMTDGRTPLHLVAIPVLWTLIAGATAWVLAIAQDLALAAVGLAALGLIVWQNRRAR